MGWPIFQQRVFLRYSLAALAENSVYSIPEAAWCHSLDWTLLGYRPIYDGKAGVYISPLSNNSIPI